jgi:hypothetical protein
MMADMQRLVDEYVAWLKDKTSLRQIAAGVEITTPYLDRHNDYLQIYAKSVDGGFLLTDDGYTVGDLGRSGCKLDGPKRKKLLEITLNGFGVTLNGPALEIRATRDNFGLRKHNLVQAMLAVNDLAYLATPTVRSLFYEDVLAWLDLSEIRFTPKVRFVGKSGYDHLFDFAIPKSRTQPERLLRAIGGPSKESAQALMFAWFDTREVRSPDAKAYAMLNDSERGVSPDIIGAFRAYDVEPLLWSERDDVRLSLAA